MLRGIATSYLVQVIPILLALSFWFFWRISPRNLRSCWASCLSLGYQPGIAPTCFASVPSPTRQRASEPAVRSIGHWLRGTFLPVFKADEFLHVSRVSHLPSKAGKSEVAGVLFHFSSARRRPAMS